MVGVIILSKEPKTEKANVSVKCDTVDHASYHHKGRCSYHWNLWHTQMQQNSRCHGL